ncbi:ferredoxin reductase [Stenotrophomonas pigmentata]|uniref:ferredoxin reductase n=1 Tax=Stenotrophomonas pigmentata TaxID=3055080 RepID=UPI0026EF45C9|nr:ferredoxin reductase [Stenotrophomonas sp. 610A2]
MSAVYRNTAPPPIPWLSEGFFDFWSTRVHPLWTLRRPLARLVARYPASADAVTLELQPNRHFLGLQAGQHINLGAELDGRLTTRSYSPTLLQSGRLAITVKRIAGGKLSQHLVQQAEVGEVFALGQAFGQMLLPATPDPKLVMLAAGSGITPMRALLRLLDAQGMPGPVDLIYWARQREQLCFVDEFNAIAARHPSFRLHLAVTGEAAPRVDSFDLASLGELDSAHVLACGPGGFVEAARARLQAKVAHFDSEAFSVPQLAELEEGSVQVQLLKSGRTLTVPRGVALLPALEAAGIQPASGCRMGICNTCVCGKTSGITRHTLTGDYTSEPSVPLKLCVSSASTDLTLEL